MKIIVTQKDIDKGLKSSCYECPIAHAFKRKLKNKVPCGVAVNAENVYHFDGKSLDKYNLPKEAKKFIQRFDNDQPVKPFTFEIEKDLK
jgi:nitrate/TMAO reductase-like tetraheme cytochrome c subunit